MRLNDDFVPKKAVKRRKKAFFKYFDINLCVEKNACKLCRLHKNKTADLYIEKSYKTKQKVNRIYYGARFLLKNARFFLQKIK